MKSYLISFPLLVLTLLCSCGKDSSTLPIPDKVDFQLLSSTPQSNSTIEPTTDKIELHFNKEILFVNDNSIKLNEKTIAKPTFSGSTLVVALGYLEEESDYTLRIEVNAMRIAGGFNEEPITLTFKTGKYPEVDIDAELVTANPSTEAQHLYSYLLKNYQTKTISGMMANVSWNNTESERIYRLTGKYPAINCYDYIHLPWSPANWIDYGDITPVKNWWDAGGIVAAGWHWTVPVAEGVTDPSQTTCTPGMTTFRAKNALMEGTWENELMKADLTKIAAYLKLLQAENIPVLWRPLHEAAGNTYEYPNGTAWFWWGYDGAEVYKKLWIYMFNYFQSQGLNNLIWVWTTQTKDDAFYPGDAYVDIVGRDLYGASVATCVTQYKEVTNNYGNKLVTLSECGTVGPISEQWNNGARWSWFMPWYDNEGAETTHASDEWWTDAMSQSFVVTRDQLPSFK